MSLKAVKDIFNKKNEHGVNDTHLGWLAGFVGFTLVFGAVTGGLSMLAGAAPLLTSSSALLNTVTVFPLVGAMAAGTAACIQSLRIALTKSGREEVGELIQAIKHKDGAALETAGYTVPGFTADVNLSGQTSALEKLSSRNTFNQVKERNASPLAAVPIVGVQRYKASAPGTKNG